MATRTFARKPTSRQQNSNKETIRPLLVDPATEYYGEDEPEGREPHRSLRDQQFRSEILDTRHSPESAAIILDRAELMSELAAKRLKRVAEGVASILDSWAASEGDRSELLPRTDYVSRNSMRRALSEFLRIAVMNANYREEDVEDMTAALQKIRKREAEAAE